MTRFEQEIEDVLERDWAALLSTRGGRRVMWDILGRCGIFRSSYRGNADTNFLEGERNIGLGLLNDRIHPNGAHMFGQMMTENAEWMERIDTLNVGDDDG